MPKKSNEDPILSSIVSWQADPSPVNADAMLGQLNPVIDYSVRQFGGRYSGPSLRSKAKVITLDVMKGYSADRGDPSPFLKSHLQGLRRYSGQETTAIPVSERHRMAWSQLKRQSEELADTLGRDPTDIELSDYVRLPPAKLKAIRRAAIGGVPESAYDESAELSVTDQDSTWRQFLHLTLPTDEQLIMEHTLGMNGKPILGTNELAKKLGVTPAAISQRKAKIQKLLDSRSM